MEIVALLVIQLVATVAAFSILWRKLDVMSGELSRVKRLLETLELARLGVVRRPQPARAEPAYTGAAPPPAPAPVWPRPLPPRKDAPAPLLRHSFLRPLMANEAVDETPPLWLANLSPETGRVIAAGAAVVAPVLGFAFGAPAQALLAAGLSIGAALMLVGLRPMWRAASWVGVIGCAGWAAAAFALEAAEAAPIIFSLFTTAAGLIGLAHARVRGLAPGATLAAAMAVALLFLGGETSMIGVAGAGFGVLAASAAVLGATSLRTEIIHFAAFAAIGAGLYVLSGQHDAAIWFTPAAAWSGALFFAISAVRVPVLGPRGVLLAGTGAVCPILAAGALFASQQGLANPWAAAGVFLSLTVMFFGLLAVAARRNGRGVAGLKLTAWILTGAAIASTTAAVALVAPPAFVAAAMAAAAAGFIIYDQRWPDGLWRGAGVASMLVAAGATWTATEGNWPSWVTIAAAFAAPTLFAALAARFAQRATPNTAAFFELAAIIGAVATIASLIRLLLSGGAPNATPLGFVEAGAQIAAMLAVSLALAARSDRGASAVRRMAAPTLAVLALVAGAVASVLWLTPWWTMRPPSGVMWPLLQHAPLGFAPPAILAWGHWVFWRGRHANIRTRTALAAAALMTAAFITMEVLSARAGALAPGALDGVSIAAAVLAFALAVGLNFAPGVTAEPGRSNLQEYLQRHGRRQERHEPR